MRRRFPHLLAAARSISIPATRATWQSLFILNLLAVCAYVFFEWLFILTKPSFMGALGLLTKIEILIVISLILYAPVALALTLPALLCRAPFLKSRASLWIAAGALPAAVILACLSLLLVDNFTYTLFKVGVVTSQNATRWIYAVFLVAGVALWWIYLLSKLEDVVQRVQAARAGRLISLGLLAAALIPGVVIALHRSTLRQYTTTASVPDRQPNILIITSDDVSAGSLSLYGYPRDTSPKLVELSKSALLAENAFANAGVTTGSVGSIYTGKHPFTTRLLYAPDILRGADAYEHLPGMLKAAGYYTIQYGVENYLDARAQNFLSAFDVVNGHDTAADRIYILFNQVLPPDSAYFANEIKTRLSDRLQHIFYLEEMVDPFKQVTQPTQKADDQIRLRRVLQKFGSSAQPVFAHVHLMETHGPTYRLSKQYFSAGQVKSAQKAYEADFYDDSLREFDQLVGMAVRELTKKGLLDKTILIIGSDHGQRWDPLQRVPLLIRFPNGERHGRITVNVQNLDIAPTILDYLGMEMPQWMEGDSLLTPGLAQRPIVVTTVAVRGSNAHPFQGFVTSSLHQFGMVSQIDCQRWRQLSFVKNVWVFADVQGYSHPCNENSLTSPEQALGELRVFLKSRGFEISREDYFPVQYEEYRRGH